MRVKANDADAINRRAAMSGQFMGSEINGCDGQRGGHRRKQIQSKRRIANRHKMLKHAAENQIQRIAGRMNETKIPRGKLKLAAVRIHHIGRERAEVEQETCTSPKSLQLENS